MSHVSHRNESCLTYEWVMSYVWMIFRHDPFTCLTWPIHMWDMTHPYVRHDSSIGESRYTWDATHSLVRHDWFIVPASSLAPWKIHASCFSAACPNPTKYGTVPPTYRHESSNSQSKTCVAVCCSVLQCVAVCCSVLQRVTGTRVVTANLRPVLQCVAVCCSVLQCVAVCCSVLQRVAVCYRMLQSRWLPWDHPRK